jgi:hypothetical protein
MSVLEFSVYAGFYIERKTSGISSSRTLWQDLEARYKSCNEANLTPRSLSRDQTREDDKLRGPSQKSAESCGTRSFVQLGEKPTTRAHMHKGEGSRCHTDFPKKTKCKPICMPGSSFMHIVTYKWIQKQYHVRKRKIIRDLRVILETKAPSITGTRLGVAYA